MQEERKQCGAVMLQLYNYSQRTNITHTIKRNGDASRSSQRYFVRALKCLCPTEKVSVREKCSLYNGEYCKLLLINRPSTRVLNFVSIFCFGLFAYLCLCWNSKVKITRGVSL